MSGGEVQIGALTVRWTGGGLLLIAGESALVLDAPTGVVDALGDDLARVHGVLLTGDRTRALTGLVPLLAALEPHRIREHPLDLRFVLGAERGAVLAEAWVRGWPDRYAIALDAEPPGSRFEVGPFAVWTLPLRTGQPHWRRGTVEPAVGVGARVSVGGVTVAWVPGAAPDRYIAKLVRGVDLAVIEIGTAAWPRTEERWRLTEREALEVCEGVGAVWLPGDDGSLTRDPN